MSRILLVAAVLAAVLATAASGAGSPTRVVRGDTSVGPIRIARTTTAQAIAALAGASRTMHRRESTCRVTWPGLGLAVDFVLIGTDPRDPCVSGAAVVASITARAGWRTAVGLRVGDSATRLRRLYPHARHHAAGYWLVPRRACEVIGAFAYPGLLARVGHGRVTALVASTAVCD